MSHAKYLAGLTLAVCLASPMARGDVTNVTVLIDASTTQPVGTGLVPADASTNIIVLVEGMERIMPIPGFADGWFDPAGKTRLRRVGQMVAGMQFGSLLGTFTALPVGWFLPDDGVINAQIADVGHELQLGLNMSNADLTTLQGGVCVHLTMIPEGEAEWESFIIDAGSPSLIPTGMVTDDANDRFLIMSLGTVRIFDDYTPDDGWFGPEGKVRLQRAGQPISDMPFGGVLGTYTTNLSSAFYVGNGGSWRTAPVDLGRELKLGLNMSASDLPSIEGMFVVNVVRVPAAVIGLGDSSEDIGTATRIHGAPNPMAGSTTIRYQLSDDGPVLIRVYEPSGRWVRTLVDGSEGAGPHVMHWDGRDDAGRRVAPGTYFCQRSTTEGSETHRLVVTP